MKKNILIAVLSVCLLISSVYAFVQLSMAKEQEKRAMANAELAEKNAEEAEKFQMIAEQNAEEARLQAMLAKQVLVECQKKKK